jgi:hypothetical protein
VELEPSPDVEAVLGATWSELEFSLELPSAVALLIIDSRLSDV